MIFKVAGALGICPLKYTIRELFWLYEGRDRQEWVHTASINAIQRAAAGEKGASLAKCHPYLADQKSKHIKRKLLELRDKKQAAKNVKNSGQD